MDRIEFYKWEVGAIEVELKSKLEDYTNKFNADTIFNICCDGCQTKIYKLQKDSGVNELKILKQEIEGLS